MAMADRNRDAFDAVVANSHWTRSQFESAGLKIDDVIWNGIEIPDLATEPTDLPTIAFAGRLVDVKGVDILLRAMATVLDNITDARLVIVGEGPIRAELTALARQLGIDSHVEFTGHLSLAESEERLAGTWIQIIPSIWAEPFGLVTAESMARGSCAIATDTGGSAELIRHEHNGLLVPPNDAESLAAAMLLLLRDENLREKLRANGRRFVREHCSMTRFVDSVESVYERILSKGTTVNPGVRSVDDQGRPT
jgi:glycosyltransferase involved in cell wall biosynthesis